MTDEPLSLDALDQARVWFFVPFAGTTGSGQVRLGPLLLTRLDWLAWRFIERTELVDEHLLPMQSPPTVVGIFSADAGADGLPPWNDAQRVRDAAAASLRLAGCADFIEPMLVAFYSMNGPMSQRQPGHYRQAMLSRHVFSPTDRVLDPQVVHAADQLYPAVASILSQDGAADLLPLNLYRQSFGPLLSAGDRLLLLFAAVEALFTPWQQRVHGTSLESRAAIAAALGGTAAPPALTSGEARLARNQHAHGEPNERAYASLVQPMQEMMRGALKSWLSLRATLPAHAETIVEFNGRLAAAVHAHASGNAAAKLVFASCR